MTRSSGGLIPEERATPMPAVFIRQKSLEYRTVAILSAHRSPGIYVQNSPDLRIYVQILSCIRLKLSKIALKGQHAPVFPGAGGEGTPAKIVLSRHLAFCYK
jgi:hypothetical protein